MSEEGGGLDELKRMLEDATVDATVEGTPEDLGTSLAEHAVTKGTDNKTTKSMISSHDQNSETTAAQDSHISAGGGDDKPSAPAPQRKAVAGKRGSPGAAKAVSKRDAGRTPSQRMPTSETMQNQGAGRGARAGRGRREAVRGRTAARVVKGRGQGAATTGT